jgi:hypothetical protein
MTRAEYERLIAEANEEHRKDLEAIERIWKRFSGRRSSQPSVEGGPMSREPAQKSAQPGANEESGPLPVLTDEECGIYGVEARH